MSAADGPSRKADPAGASRERLQKALARAGLGSRRACDELVRAGRVRVNGETAELGRQIDASTDVVEVDGVRVALNPEHVYLALNKPAGVINTMKDPQGRPTVADLVPQEPRVFPVGRLDADTSGLLLFTNDGELANRLTHPRYEVPKTYVAQVRGPVTQARLRHLKRGVDLEDGPARAELVKHRAASQGRSVVELTLREGRNRLVRRMLEAVGLDVESLARTAVGGVRLGRLKEGQTRSLRAEEVRDLYREAAAVD